MSLLDTASLIVTPNGYKEGKLYSVIPSDGSGDLSVTRATTATRVNSAGLVELVPYNLLSYSEDLTNAAWTSINTTEVIGATAPDGTATAWTLSKSAANGRLYQVPASTDGSMVASVYAKAGTLNQVAIEMNTSYRVLDLSTGTLVSGGSGSYNIEDVGNGWYRFSVVDSSYSGVAIWANPASSTSGNILIWHPQVEAGTTATTYQKTETRLNIPRLDYSNGTCPSILVEPQRTNLALYSSSFDNANWNKSSGTITANSTIAPDGTTTADLFTADGTQNNHDFFQGFTGGSSTTSTIYLKKNTAQYAYISLNYQGSGSDWATGIYDLDNLTTATFQSGGVTNQVATISDEGNGWRRITLSVSTGNTALFCMYGVSDSMSPSLSARGRVENSSSASFYAWGAQLEAGSYATSYIPTTSASVTRNAESFSTASIPSLFGSTEGSFFIDLTFDNTNPNGAIPLFLRSSVSNQFSHATYLQFGSNDVNLSVYNSGTLQASIAGGTFTNGQNIKIGFAYKANDFVMYVNGVLIGTDTSGSISTSLAFIDIGSYLFLQSTFQYNGIVKAAALWKTRLTNTQLAQLTTI